MLSERWLCQTRAESSSIELVRQENLHVVWGLFVARTPVYNQGTLRANLVGQCQGMNKRKKVDVQHSKNGWTERAVDTFVHLMA